MNEQGRAARGSPAGGPPHNSPLCPLPRAGLALPLAAAEDWLARLDERLRGSPIREGFINRTHVQEACASLWLEGALVSLKDLVLHDARMDIRAPTHELTRAPAVLRAPRRIAAEASDWALSPEGLAALRGGAKSLAEEGNEGRGEGSEDAEPERLGAGAGAGPLRAERAALGRALAKSTRVLAGDKAAAKPLRDWFLDDPDDENERIEAWRAAAAASSDPPCLAAALLWDAWEQNPPLARKPWLGNLLVSAALRTWQKTKSHLFPLSSALRLIRREKRRSPDRTARLAAFLEAVAAGAQASLKEDDRLLLVRQSFEAKLKAAHAWGTNGAANCLRLRRVSRRRLWNQERGGLPPFRPEVQGLKAGAGAGAAAAWPINRLNTQMRHAPSG